MIRVPETSELADFDLRDFTIPPLQKYIDKRGYMYILYDESYPDYIKVGRTCDLYKRLIQYNSDKPFKTAYMLFVSEMFEDVSEVERKILAYMYDNTPPTTLSKEWFPNEYKDKIIDIIEKAECIEKNKREINALI